MGDMKKIIEELIDGVPKAKQEFQILRKQVAGRIQKNENQMTFINQLIKEKECNPSKRSFFTNQ